MDSNQTTPSSETPPGTGSRAGFTAGSIVGGGRYRLKSVIGGVGRGVVWLAEDVRLGGPVALKFLPPEISRDPVTLDEVRRAVLKCRALTHPHIVRIHDFHGEPDGAPFVAMEYVEGESLHTLRLKQPGRVFAWEFLAPLVQQLCEALDYAHGDRVIHRALKPANLTLDGKGRLKLADFSIAAAVGDSMNRLSPRGSTSGTLACTSPQQLDGGMPCPADDIYALGAALYELLTSRPPFFSGDIAHQIRHVPATPMDERLAELEIQNNIPPAVAAMVMACLAKDPAHRPPSVRAVADWLGLPMSADVHIAAAASRPETLEEAVALPKTMGRAMVGAFAVIMLAVLGGWLYFKSHPITKPPAASAKAVKRPPPAVVKLPTASSPSVPIALPSPSKPTQIPAEQLGANLPGEFRSLFNGRDFTGWQIGSSTFWTINDGTIVGQGRGRAHTGSSSGTSLSWEDGKVDDFEMEVTYRLVDATTPKVKYRGATASRTLGQAMTYSSQRGYSVNLSENKDSPWPTPLGSLTGEGRPTFFPGERLDPNRLPPSRLQNATRLAGIEAFRNNDWNTLAIVSVGNRLVHKLNGRVIVDFTDDDSERQSKSGSVSVSLSATDQGAIIIKDIRLKQFNRMGVKTEEKFSLIGEQGLTGWKGDPRYWAVENGVLTGRWRAGQANSSPVTLEWTNGLLQNFDLKLTYRVSGTGAPVLDYLAASNPEAVGDLGYAANLDNYGAGAKSGAGNLIHLKTLTTWKNGASHTELQRAPLNFSGVYLSSNKKARPPFILNGWNELTIRATGGWLKHGLNGTQIINFASRKGGGSGRLSLCLFTLPDRPVTLEIKSMELRHLADDAK
ncbi:MAG: DUF1080 domain-containing protein [Verrucomicrobia bacterium]|nr:DUF1080 domain-containing protein [Verrucomicrobiota bacterium]